MSRCFWLVLLLATGMAVLAAESGYPDIDQPPHEYWKRSLKDRFTQLKGDLESGAFALDQSTEKAFVESLLRVLGIPATSQMLVFSTTSLQLSRISPTNPRALYFTDDLYVGYVPGGQIEVVSIDPELGGIFYIFDIPRNGQSVRVDRATRCMNCHAGADSRHVPGLVIKSVVPGPRGGSLTAYRLEQTGHEIPFDQRFGGWVVTGKHNITNHWGNLTGQLSPQGLQKFPVQAGERFKWERYPVATSDILPHLLHEHQAGFVNRLVEASYRARAHLHTGSGKLGTSQAKELDDLAGQVVRYLLFAEEAPLTGAGIEGDPAFKVDFLRSRRTAANGSSLKDFDLRTRLFKHRCSYMIYSPVFQGLPPDFKQRIYRRLKGALDAAKPDPEYAYLPGTEKQAIRAILKATVPDLPATW
jgi:hypothetical protein